MILKRPCDSSQAGSSAGETAGGTAWAERPARPILKTPVSHKDAGAMAADDHDRGIKGLVIGAIKGKTRESTQLRIR